MSEPAASPLISLVVPVFNEEHNIEPFLRDLELHLQEPHEILIVYDSPADSTLPAIRSMQPPSSSVKLLHNTLGPGVLNALKFGFAGSHGDVVIVMMADRSDDPGDVSKLAAGV